MSIKHISQPEGLALLESLPAYSQCDPLSLASSLRERGYCAELVSEALTQLRLRERAQEKFGEQAQSMLFTADGAEQATRWEVAQYHAHCLASRGAQHVIDVGCGIGSDSLAFARAGMRVTAIEMNPEAAQAARFNLRNYPNARVIEADAFNVDVEAFAADALWLDPARRESGRRIYDPEQWQPSLSAALELASHYSFAGIKIAPGIDYSYLPATCHAQWISYKRSLVEAVIWLADAMPESGSGRSAVIFAGDGAGIGDGGRRGADALSNGDRSRDGEPSSAHIWAADTRDPSEDAVQLDPAELDAYIIEPDPAIIRSGGIASFAERYGLSPIAHGIAYLSGSSPAPERYAQSFLVRAVFRVNVKKVGAYLRERDITSVEIKKRGIDISPELLRKQLKLNPSSQSKPSEKSAVIIASPLLESTGEGQSAHEKKGFILAERAATSAEY